MCGNCHAEMNDEIVILDNPKNRHYRKYKQKGVDYLGGICYDCGYDKNINALCFHHRHKEDKSFGVGYGALNWKWETIQKELDKCDLVCVICHRIRHYIEKWSNISIVELP